MPRISSTTRLLLLSALAVASPLSARTVHRYDASGPGQSERTFLDGVGSSHWTLNNCSLDTGVVSAGTRLTAAYRLAPAGQGSGGTTPAFPGGNTTFEVWVRPGSLDDSHQVIFETGGGQNGSSFLITGAAIRYLNSRLDTRHFDITIPLAGIDTGDFIQLVASLDESRGVIDVYVRGAAGGRETRRATGPVGRGGNAASLFTWGASVGSLGGGHNGLGGRTEAPGMSPSGLTQFRGEIALLKVYDTALTAAEVDAAFGAVAGRLPSIDSFTATPSRIRGGETATLSWVVRDSTGVFIEPGIGDVTARTTDGRGSFGVAPAMTTVYTLLATDGRVEKAAGVQVIVDDLLLPPRITEFVADNRDSLVDGNGLSSDWIEIHNANLFPLDLEGHHLTDTREDLEKWRFPPFVIEGGGYGVIFASGREADDVVDAAGFLHTTFRLSSSGEYLALVHPDGATVLSEYAPGYPEQFEDVSFGIDAEGAQGYFPEPTPGEPNGERVLGFVKEAGFSITRGFFDNPIRVALSTPTPGASIRFTTDGSAPSGDSAGEAGHGTLYTGPADISTTTTLRAIAYRDGLQPARVVTHTYIYLQDVIRQPNNPPGFPGRWAGVPADYEMDPDVIGEQNLFNDRYRNTVIEDLLSLPTLSIVMDRKDLFGRTGLYDNPQAEGVAWERPASVELFYPDGSREGFHVNCGIRIQGGSGRSPNYPKHALRLLFKRIYGPGKLRYPLFADQPEGDSATDEFDTITLRGGFNNSWTHWHWFQNPRAQYIRDQWIRDSQLAMGWPSPHGSYVHLYINGLYWGLYNPCERPTAPFMASYYGGSKEDYDTQNVNEAKDGDLRAWNTMMSIANGGVATPEAYARIREYLDVVNLADYMLLNFYVGNDDWDGHNWYAGRKREPGAGYQFFCWDSELIISRHAFPPPQPDFNVILNLDRTGLDRPNKPSRVYTRLRSNPDFRILFADRIQKHFFNDGALTTENSLKRWNARHDQVWRAVVPESARWGDYRRDVHQHQNYTPDQYDLFHRDKHYVAQRNWLVNTYFPRRRDIVLRQFRRRGLWPAVEAPRFSQHGGRISPGFLLDIDAPEGVIYFSLDGSDPRLSGGDVAAGAQVYAGPVTLAQTTRVLARAHHESRWSPLADARFSIGRPAAAGDVVVRALHYHPLTPGAPEVAAGFPRRSDFEYLELGNITGETIDLAGARFIDGIRYRFEVAGASELAPGESVFLVRNPAAFEFRFGAGLPLADGGYEGRLSDDGERLALASATGELLLDFTYNDAPPWPGAADGEGCALLLADPFANPDPADPASWRSGPPARRDGPGCGADCNQNGAPDSADIAGGVSRDENRNGVPDECEASRVPGDCNQDGRLNISDGICVIGFLFLGSPAALPCGDGQREDPANLLLVDWQPDRRIDVSDAIALLQYLFAGGPPHPLAIPGGADQCVLIPGCSASASCR